MKQIFTLCLFLIALYGDSQNIVTPSITKLLDSKIPACKVGTSSDKPPRRVGCSTAFVTPPLYIIDGVPAEGFEIAELDANNIESITILKDSTARIIGCSWNYSGVILITTKNQSIDYIIRDALTGKTLRGATAEFTHNTSTKMYMSDENGLITAGELKRDAFYDLKVTMAGFKASTTTIHHRRGRGKQFIDLERDVKECGEVTVVGYGRVCICRRIGCGGVAVCSIVKEEAGKSQDISWKDHALLFPNPIMKGQAFIVDMKNKIAGSLQVRLVGLDGKLLRTEFQNQLKSDQRFSILTDSRWTPGIYFVQLIDEKGKLLQTEKLVIQ